jgi:hypothetical protein
MKSSFYTRAHLLASLAGGALMLTACGGGGGGDGVQPMTTAVDPTVQVSPQASTNATAAASYVDALASTPTSTANSLEPVAVPAALATDDTAEPV